MTDKLDDAVRPVYQARRAEIFRWMDCEQEHQKLLGDKGYEIRTLYPPSAIAHLQARVDALTGEVERLTERNAELEGLAKYCDLLTHKLITCGVAASHPDAGLSKRGRYAAKWDSPMAQEVRVLRDKAEAAERRVASAMDILARITDKFEDILYQEYSRDDTPDGEIAAARVILSQPEADQ
jgi:hypothetical protein